MYSKVRKWHYQKVTLRDSIHRVIRQTFQPPSSFNVHAFILSSWSSSVKTWVVDAKNGSKPFAKWGSLFQDRWARQPRNDGDGNWSWGPGKQAVSLSFRDTSRATFLSRNGALHPIFNAVSRYRVLRNDISVHATGKNKVESSCMLYTVTVMWLNTHRYAWVILCTNDQKHAFNYS